MKDLNELFSKPAIATHEGRRDRVIFDLLFCGLSIDEILNLKLGDLNLRERAVLWTGNRIVPLPTCVVEMLKQYIGNMPCCQGLSADEIRQKIDGYIPGMTPETIKKILIEDLEAAGAGQREIWALLGKWIHK